MCQSRVRAITQISLAHLKKEDMLSSRRLGSMSTIASTDISSSMLEFTDQGQSNREVEVVRRYRRGCEPRTRIHAARGSILPNYSSQNGCNYTDVFTVKP